MPDQVRVPDPHPNRQPSTLSSSPLHHKMLMGGSGGQQDHLLLNFDYPVSQERSGQTIISNSNSNSNNRNINNGGHHSMYNNSPGHSSSGYSDGSCGSSPARSPNHHLNMVTYRDNIATDNNNGVVNEKPLSLVIRKNSDNQDAEYTVHPKIGAKLEYSVMQERSDYRVVHKTSAGSLAQINTDRYPPYQQDNAARPGPSPAEVLDESSRDSGTEDLEHRPLIISVQEEEVEGERPAEEEVIRLEEQTTAQDFSLKRRPEDRAAEEDHHHKNPLVPASNQPQGPTTEMVASGISAAATAIKIKDFARLTGSSEPMSLDQPGVQQPLKEQRQRKHTTSASTSSYDRATPRLEISEDFSDVSSECPSLSSVDTWQSSLVEGKPFSVGSDVVIRRVSRTSNGETVYQCDFCEKMFANKSHLHSHLVTHTGERAFNCRVCRKTFGRKSTLRAHMTTHTKVSNFMCTVCEKACNDNNSLEEHMRMHTGEKPFVCTICQKAYARKSHLNVHYRVHTGERPFVCHHCDKDFTEKRFLNDHLQTAHNGADGPLRCPNCCREFAYKTSLKQHLKKQMCERNMNRAQGNNTGNGGNNNSSSSSNNNNNNNNNSNTSNAAGAGGSLNSPAGIPKQFQCPFCDKSYSWKQTLKQHVSMYHRNKVHTDEFWRFELTKNRRAVIDDKVNEDLWKKQLGKHAEEAAKQLMKQEGNAGKEDGGVGGERREQQLQWLDQITRVPATREMKLLALQSLQNSLHYMSMNGGVKAGVERRQSAKSTATATSQSAADVALKEDGIEPVVVHNFPIPITSFNNNNQSGAHNNNNTPSFNNDNNNSSNSNNNNSNTTVNLNNVIKEEVVVGSGENYLSLLAQLAAKDSSKGNSRLQPPQSAQAQKSDTNNMSCPPPLPVSPPLLPTNEESAVKRTQLWLQQVNKYRSNISNKEGESQPLLSDSTPAGVDATAANHDQLWEEQIARVKRNPVKSPLEPVEILLDDSSVVHEEDRGVSQHHNHQQQQLSRLGFGGGVAVKNLVRYPNHNIPRHREILQPFGTMSNNNNNNSTTTNNNITVNNNNSTTTNNNITVNNNNSNNNNNNNESLSIFQANFLPIQQKSRRDLSPLPPAPRARISITESALSPRPVTPLIQPHPPLFEERGRQHGDSSSSSRSHTPHGDEKNTTGSSGRSSPLVYHLGEDKSMLKSLLLDRMKRKHSSSSSSIGESESSKKPCPPSPVAVGVNRPASASIVSRPIPVPESGPQDILRKRLLGWVDPPTPGAGKSGPPVSTAPPARSQLPRQEDEQQQEVPRDRSGPSQQQDEMFQLQDLNPSVQTDRQETTGVGEERPITDKNALNDSSNSSEEGKKSAPISYTHTSVLKHLLYRYTGATK